MTSAPGGAEGRIGSYRIVRQLASGGMGVVWVAESTLRGRQRVALKTLHTWQASSPAIMRGLLDEARLGALLQHRNIVRTLDVGLEQGRLFLVLELLSGCTLALTARQLAYEPAPAGMVVALGLQALAGLGFAHGFNEGGRTGVIHRDIKPSNLFLTNSGVLKLIDFGIAVGGSLDRTETRTGHFRGSIRYASPEQVSETPLDARSDLFSLAVVLYELLAGKPLYDQLSEAAVVSAILWRSAPPLGLHRADVPPALDEVLARAMMKSPAERFASAAEFASALADSLPASELWSEEQLGAWAAAQAASGAQGPTTQSGAFAHSPGFVLPPETASMPMASPGGLEPPPSPAFAARTDAQGRGSGADPRSAAPAPDAVRLAIAPVPRASDDDPTASVTPTAPESKPAAAAEAEADRRVDGASRRDGPRISSSGNEANAAGPDGAAPLQPAMAPAPAMDSVQADRQGTRLRPFRVPLPGRAAMSGLAAVTLLLFAFWFWRQSAPPDAASASIGSAGAGTDDGRREPSGRGSPEAARQAGRSGGRPAATPDLSPPPAAAPGFEPDADASALDSRSASNPAAEVVPLPLKGMRPNPDAPPQPLRSAGATRAGASGASPTKSPTRSKATRPARPPGVSVGAEVTIDSRPLWAEISLDGKRLGPTPIYRHYLDEGRHVLEAARPDGARKKKVIQLAPGEHQKVVFHF